MHNVLVHCAFCHVSEKTQSETTFIKNIITYTRSEFQSQADQVKDLISEVNVKSLEYITDTSGLINKKIKANFKTLGKRLGKDKTAARGLLLLCPRSDPHIGKNESIYTGD